MSEDGPFNFCQKFDVSRETLEKLEKYVALVEKWNPSINLVSKSSIDDIWTRHIADSAQVYQYGRGVEHWVDLGSGGGFPGIVVAILGSAEPKPFKITLVESDQRKCAFLRAAARESKVDISVISDRIEKIPCLQADILSARALASLDDLLGFASMHLKADGNAVFPKGASYQKEIQEARKKWNFKLEEFPSSSDTDAVILRVGAISNA